MFLGITDVIVELIYKLLITIVSLIYKLVGLVYQIFLVLAQTNLFEQDLYESLTDKVYIILAVVMLFVAAYTFITLIIDPDKNKGGKAIEDLIKKAITSLILIVLCPTLFTLAFDLQSAIMKQNIIGQFFTSESTDYDATASVKTGGHLMAGTTWAAFFTPSMDEEPADIDNQSNGKKLDKGDGENESIDCSSKGKCTLEDANAFAQTTGQFGIYTAFSYNWVNSDESGGVEFNFFLALIAGGYLVYVIVSFCFDLAIRVIKLAFYQIIAPICIACRILPDKESIFKNWWKAVSKTYLSVFIRVFIMNLGVFLLVQLNNSNFWEHICTDKSMECGGAVEFIAKAFIVMGLLTFIKQAAKLIDEIFGLGDVKLGITDKFKEGGGFAGIAMAKAGKRGVIAGFKNGWKWKPPKPDANATPEELKKYKKAKRNAILHQATAGLRGAAVGAGAMISSLGKSTNGFGTDKFVREMEKAKANADASAQQAEITMERAAKFPGKIGQYIEDAKEWYKLRNDEKALQAKIEELKQQLAKHLRNEDLEVAIKLKGEVEKLNATLTEKTKERDNHWQKLQDDKQREIKEAEQHLNDLQIAGASDKTIKEAEEAVKKRKEEYAKLNEDATLKRLEDEISQMTSEVHKVQASYQEEKRKYADKYSVTVDEAEATFQAETKEIQLKIDEAIEQIKVKQTGIENLELSGLFSNLKDNFDKYCFNNPNGILQIMDERLDGVTKKIEKVASKYNHAISVSFEDAMKKNTLLNGLTDDKKQILLTDAHFALGKASVQQIEAVSRSLKSATTFEQVEQILGKDLCAKLDIKDHNYTKFQQAFIDTIDNPYHKEVIKYTADFLNDQRTGDANDTKIQVSHSQRTVVHDDRDSADARTEEFAYQVAYDAIYGKDGSAATYKGKKDLQDRLRDQSRKGQRHDIRNTTEEKIYKVTTDDKNGK